MPGSPLSNTTCPRPSLTCSQRSISKPTSCSRPTNGVSVVLSCQRRSALPFTLHVVDGNGRIDAFDQMRAKGLTLKLAFDQALRRGADDHRIGFG